MLKVSGARLVGVLLIAAFAAVGGRAEAASYSANVQFSATHNPHGVWSYTVNGALLTQKILCGNIAGWNCWWNGNQVPNSAVVGKNGTGKTQTYLTIVSPAGYIILDPEANTDVAVQWIAPAAGTYTIKGNFLGIDTSEVAHPVAVAHNGTSIYSNTISAYNQKEVFSLTQKVAKGDTISFVVRTSVFNNLSTGLVARIISGAAP